MRRNNVVILTAVLALALFVATAMRTPSPGRLLADPQVAVRPHSPVIGRATAPVTIAEFLDPACEACRAFYPQVKQILAAYPNDVRLVIRYVPFHAQASITGIKILEAARRQQRFEPVLDALMQSQPVWASHMNPAISRAWEFAGEAGLNVEQARAYAATGEVEKMLEQDVADRKALGVRTTPAFFVNGKRLKDRYAGALLQMVESELERVRNAGADTVSGEHAEQPQMPPT